MTKNKRNVSHAEPLANVAGSPPMFITEDTEPSRQISADAAAEPVPIRHYTGPITAAGRKRSGRNSIVHGIFSNVTVLPGESWAEYQALLKQLRKSLQPEGGFENLLVDKLASLVWRHRRAIGAESAEIRGRTEFYERDQRILQENQVQAADADGPFNMLGLINEKYNLIALERCLELLAELRQNIRKMGFHEKHDTEILTTIYGVMDFEWDAFPRTYRCYLRTAQLSEQERKIRSFYTPAECVEHFLKLIDEEVQRLQTYKDERGPIEAKRTALEVLQRKLPDGTRLDQIIRYEAHIERCIERILNQLDRAQRQRKGQSALPRIDVNVSTEH